MTIRPLEGIGSLAFGMSREEVFAELGTPDRSKPRIDFFYGGMLRVFYTDDGKVETVEIARGGPLRPILYGIPVLELSSKEVVSRLARLTPVKADHFEYPHTAIFADIEVSLWRPADPDAPPDTQCDAVSASRLGLLSGVS